jgi:hypothetical protein
MGAKQTYDLAKVIEAERKTAPVIEIVAGEEKFTIDAPTLWPDTAFEAAAQERLVDAARILLGERYDAFVAAGGSAAILFMIVKESQRASLPE